METSGFNWLHYAVPGLFILMSVCRVLANQMGHHWLKRVSCPALCAPIGLVIAVIGFHIPMCLHKVRWVACSGHGLSYLCMLPLPQYILPFVSTDTEQTAQRRMQNVKDATIMTAACKGYNDPWKKQCCYMLRCAYCMHVLCILCMHVLRILCWVILYHVTLLSIAPDFASGSQKPPKPYFRCICRQTLIWKCSLLGFENVAFLGFESFDAILCTVWLWLHDR